MTTKHAAMYARVSTEAQWEEGYSIEAQKQMLDAYCVSRGIEERRFYIDGGYSGANTDRPMLKTLIEEIKKGNVSEVIVYKLDRFSRSQKDTLYLIEDILIPNNVAFISMNENMDTSTPIGRAMLGIMSAFAQLERETIKERTRMGMLERVKSGLWMGGGRVPFGYDYDKESGKLIPNEDAQVVKDIYSLYLDGYSPRRIAQMTGLKYERLAIQILKRKSNIGSIVYKGVEYENCHEPIISKNTFELAMRQMAIRAKSTSGAKCLLAGLIYCGVCGSKMRYQKWSGGEYKIYCYSRDPSKSHIAHTDKCDNIRVDAAELENEVLADLFSMTAEGGGEDEDRGDSLKILENTVYQCKRRLSRLYDLYSSAEDEILLGEINRKKDELAKAQLEYENMKLERKRSSEAAQRFSKLSAVRGAWEKMSVEERRGILCELIEKIVITYERVEIHYTKGTISRRI